MLLRLLFCFLAVVGFSGCMKLKQVLYVRPLLTLKASSDEGDTMDSYVKAQDMKFEALVAALYDGTLEHGLTQEKIKEGFGDPVMIENVTRNNQEMTLWLRRYTVRYWDSDKVYLYFDKAGKLQDWEFVTFVKKQK